MTEGHSGFGPLEFYFSLALLVAGTACAYMSFGLPNHYYQGALAIMILGLSYHRESLRRPKNFQWILAALNLVFLTLVLKLAIGGGIRLPFSWLRYPDLALRQPPQKLLSILPSWSVTWQPTDLALWSVDLTVVQTFLFLLTVLSSVAGFQIFASLTAFFLLVISVPVLASFQWDWVFPAIALGGVGLYMQLPRPSKT